VGTRLFRFLLFFVFFICGGTGLQFQQLVQAHLGGKFQHSTKIQVLVNKFCMAAVDDHDEYHVVAKKNVIEIRHSERITENQTLTLRYDVRPVDPKE
jgi:hypothetical protein